LIRGDDLGVRHDGDPLFRRLDPARIRAGPAGCIPGCGGTPYPDLPREALCSDGPDHLGTMDAAKVQVRPTHGPRLAAIHSPGSPEHPPDHRGADDAPRMKAARSNRPSP